MNGSWTDSISRAQFIETGAFGNERGRVLTTNEHEQTRSAVAWIQIPAPQPISSPLGAWRLNPPGSLDGGGIPPKSHREIEIKKVQTAIERRFYRNEIAVRKNLIGQW